jgi:hypothetical protein
VTGIVVKKSGPDAKRPARSLFYRGLILRARSSFIVGFFFAPARV